MHYTSNSDGSTITIAMSGTLDFEDHTEVRALMRTLQSSDENRVRFDLAEVTAIDSAGIGLLLLTNDRLKKAGKCFSLTGSKGVAARSLDLARIGEMVPMD